MCNIKYILTNISSSIIGYSINTQSKILIFFIKVKIITMFLFVFYYIITLVFIYKIEKLVTIQII